MIEHLSDQLVRARRIDGKLEVSGLSERAHTLFSKTTIDAVSRSAQRAGDVRARALATQAELSWDEAS